MQWCRLSSPAKRHHFITSEATSLHYPRSDITSSPAMATQLKKTRVELNNAVFSLPDLVARAEGYFEQEGLDVELVLPEKRKAMLAQAGARASELNAIQSFLWHEGIEKGEFSVYHACEWGQMRRTQDTCTGAKVITKRAAVSTQAIVVGGDSPCNVPQ